MTFSIVARDPVSGDLGIAVQSKFPSVGSLVPWIATDAGVIATQALANLEYGRSGIKLLRSGATAQQTLNILLENDQGRGQRQVGIIDLYGNAVSFTGDDCYNWAGGLIGEGVACQGNILVGKETVESMLKTYNETEGDLAEKLMCALEAGQEAGGDSRGQQSANLLVYRINGGYGGGSDVYIDVRVDDHPNATTELRRVFDLYSLTLLEREDPNEITKLSGQALARVSQKLEKLGYLENVTENEEEILQALTKWFHTENFENKERGDEFIWNSVLNYLLRME
ncbi:MAG: DUF1028 domain-containing protein [Candidatus Heimdallarchaeota archaeon]|nr:DUF1028 domain-containing protein [Candidatus Heimdallarchaeota archaeon]